MRLDKVNILNTAIGGILGSIFLYVVAKILNLISSLQIFIKIKKLIFYNVTLKIPVIVLILGTLLFIGLFKFDWLLILHKRWKYSKKLFLKLARDKINSTPVYAIIGKEKRHIATQTTLYALGYKHEDVIEVSREYLDKYKEGKPISIEQIFKNKEPVRSMGDQDLIGDQNLILSDEPIDNAAFPGSPNAPRQSHSLMEREIPEKAILLTISASGFSPNEFDVKSGDVVTISLISADRTHVFKFDDLSLRGVAIGVAGGEIRAISFKAPSIVGGYTFYCDVPGHRGRGETGVMHVR